LKPTSYIAAFQVRPLFVPVRLALLSLGVRGGQHLLVITAVGTSGQCRLLQALTQVNLILIACLVNLLTWLGHLAHIVCSHKAHV
jgi:hypothetical protein